MRQLTLHDLIGLPRATLINLETEMIGLMLEPPSCALEYRISVVNFRSVSRVLFWFLMTGGGWGRGQMPPAAKPSPHGPSRASSANKG